MTECKSRSCPGHRWEWIHVRVRMCACVHVCEQGGGVGAPRRTREDIGLRSGSVQMHAVMHVPRFGQRGEGSAGLWSNDFKVLTALRPFSARGVTPAACPAVQAFDRFNGRTSGTRTLGAMPNEGIHGRKQGARAAQPAGRRVEADRLTATSRGDDTPMPMSIRGTPDSLCGIRRTVSRYGVP